MGYWFTLHWYDLIQTIGIIGGLVFGAVTEIKADRSRRITNLIAIKEQYNEIWRELFRKPGLARILKSDVDLEKSPATAEEQLFVKMLLLHLDTLRRTVNARMFVRMEEVQKDVRDFLSLPIPKFVWKDIKPFQDRDFVEFVESALAKR
jgi:hypothetical protein